MSGLRDELHRPVRPRAGRWVPLVLVVVWLVVFGALAAGYPPYPGIGIGDRIGFLLVAGTGGWLLMRFGTVAVLPDETGLVVRNVLTRRRLAWAEVVGVRFGRDSTFGPARPVRRHHRHRPRPADGGRGVGVRRRGPPRHPRRAAQPDVPGRLRAPRRWAGSPVSRVPG